MVELGVADDGGGEHLPVEGEHRPVSGELLRSGEEAAEAALCTTSGEEGCSSPSGEEERTLSDDTELLSDSWSLISTEFDS